MRYLIFSVLVSLSFSFQVSGQLNLMFATGSVNSVTHGSCFGNNGQASVKITVVKIPGPAAAGGYTLNVLKDGVAFTTLTSTTRSPNAYVDITLNSLPPGNYTLNGSIECYNPSTLATYGTPAIPDFYLKVGYQAIWSTIKEMAVQTLPSSVLQNVTTPTQTYSGARSSNDLSGDSWVIAGANFSSGSSANRSVYLSFSNTANLVSFVPASNTGYIEFRKGGTSTATTGDGVYVRFSSTVYKLNSVLLTDRVRVERSGNAVSFYLNQATTALSATNVSTAAVTTGLTVAYTNAVNFTAFASVSGDGLLDVASSTMCNTGTDAYAGMTYELDGYYHVMKHGKLRFVFNNEYDSQTKLMFNIYNANGSLVRTQANYPDVPVTNGDNYIVIDLTADLGCLGEGMYYLEAINDKKEKFYLRFYSDYNIICPLEELPGGLGG